MSAQPVQDGGDAWIQKGIEGDGNNGCRDDGVGRLGRQYAVVGAQGGQNKGKLANLGQRHGHAQRLAQRPSEQQNHKQGGGGFAHQDKPQSGQGEGPCLE